MVMVFVDHLEHFYLMSTCVSIILYFRLLFFGILVTLVAWFSFHFFPSCLSKCKQRLRNIFLISSPKVTKNQKQKMGWRKHLSTNFVTLLKKLENPYYDSHDGYDDVTNLLRDAIPPHIRRCLNTKQFNKIFSDS